MGYNPNILGTSRSFCRCVSGLSDIVVRLWAMDIPNRPTVTGRLRRFANLKSWNPKRKRWRIGADNICKIVDTS